ncbi:MAG TPA: ABC transporter substrate-binding protein, partial [Acidimicrobiia bacterium]|nr:ABC transporter substrate-binding protein [Acidimicrobiia bacterium]
MAALQTIEAGTLLVASAFPDPPFEVTQDGVDTGFDAELMRAVCGQIGLRWQITKYEGDDFNGIFDGLRTHSYDAVASGTTITPEREKVALFSEPYLESGQSLVVNTTLTPYITSTDDLADQVVGIQTGNTSDIVARELKENAKLAGIRYYPYSGILEALDDLEAGRIGGVMKLLPVATWLVKDRPDLDVVQEIHTDEFLGIAFAPDNRGLRDAVNTAL